MYCSDFLKNHFKTNKENTGVFEIGLSDFHKLTFTVLKQYYLKGYLRYKMITSQNVPSEAQVKNFFVS